MTTGGDFDYTDDSVQARLSVDVPADALGAISQIAERTAEMRTHMEAAARAQGDFVEYLRTLPQLLEQAESAGQRFQDAVIVRPGADISGSPADPFNRGYRPGTGPVVPAAEAAREGQRIQRERDREAGSAPPPTEEDIARDLDTLARTDPRQAANMATQRERATAPGRPPAPARPGSGRPANRPDATSDSEERSPEQRPPRPDRSTPDRDWVEEARSRMTQGQGFLNQVLGETRQGANPLATFGFAAATARSAAQSVQRQIQTRTEEYNAAQLADHLANGGTEEDFVPTPPPGVLGVAGRVLPGAAGTVARGAGVAGLAVSAAMATQSVGQQYQQYKNLGLIRGGGAAEGLGYEMGIRTMALNPFLTTEQSRQIIMGALSQGYTGKEFDTVTDFMAENLRQLNVSAAESMKLIQQQGVQGGQSLTSLRNDLETMRGLSETGYLTYDQRREQATGLANQAVGMGASGEQGMNYGMLSTQLFANDQLMAPFGQQFGGAALNNVAFRQAIAGELGLSGVPNQMIPAALQNNYSSEQISSAGFQVINDRLRSYATMYANAAEGPAGEGQRGVALQGAITTLGAWGMPVSPQQAAQILRQVGEGTWTGVPGQAEQDISQEEQAVEERSSDITVPRAVSAIPGLGFLGGMRLPNIELPGGATLLPGGNLGRGVSANTNRLGNAVAVAATGIGDLLEGVGGAFGIGNGNEGWESSRAAMQELTTEYENDTAQYVNPRIQELVSQYGSGALTVQREGGGEERLDQNNQAQMQELAEGRAKLRNGDGGDWMSVDELSAATDAGIGGGSGGNALDVQINVTPAPELRRLLHFDTSGTRTPTQQNADQGRAGSANNSPAATEGLPWPIDNGGR